MSYESNNGSYVEMEDAYEVEVVSLGRILEGEGQIRSTMPEHEYDGFAEALTQSLARIEEPDCAACGDGRSVKRLANGMPGKRRPRKFGGNLSPVVMVGLGDRQHLSSLQGGKSIHAVSEEIAKALANKESGHVDCGAAAGLVKHVETVGTQTLSSPNVLAVKAILRDKMPEEDEGYIDELVSAPIAQAPTFAEVLKDQDWSGHEYIGRLAQKDGSAVEILETDDTPLHGHAEQAVVLIDGPVDEDGRPKYTVDKDKLMELTGHQAFIENLKELHRDADVLGETTKQKRQLLAASLLHHIAGVYPNLGDGSHPVFILRIA